MADFMTDGPLFRGVCAVLGEAEEGLLRERRAREELQREAA